MYVLYMLTKQKEHTNILSDKRGNDKITKEEIRRGNSKKID